MSLRSVGSKKGSAKKTAPKDRFSERRSLKRHALTEVEFRGLTSIDSMTQVARMGQVINASRNGLLLRIEREDLAPKALKQTLSLNEIEGDKVYVTIAEMDLEISGNVARTKRISKDTFELAIDFSADAPEYWRECFLEMLPRMEGESEDEAEEA